MSPEEHGEAQPLRLAIFLLPLPEPLPLPHLETYLFVGDEHPELEDIGLLPAPLDDPGTYPEASIGRLGVSIRVWQHKEDIGGDTLREAEKVELIVKAMLSEDDYHRMLEHDDDPDEDPVQALPFAEGEQLEEPVAYSTILEAVTPFVDRGGHDRISDAFDAAVLGASRLVRAFRIASKLPVAPLTRERLPFAIYFLTRNAIGDDHEWSHGLMLTRLREAALHMPPVSGDQLGSFNEHLLAIEAQHPLVPHVERRVDAQYALEGLGDTANAVIFAELSSVILLDVILALLCWDEGASIEETAGTLDRPFASRVQREYAPRLGGDWNISNTARPVGRWFSDLYQLRNRVLHGGHVPDRAEAARALAAADGLSKFVLDRVLTNRNRRPRTVLVVFNLDGLERRGALSNRMRATASRLEAQGPLLNAFAERQALVDAERSRP